MSQSISSEFDMKIDILHALEDFLDAYSNHSEMVVTEAIANAIDIKATQIEVVIGKDEEKNPFISFHNDGPAMTRQQFDDYHVIARSSKTKGKGIGFAGIGAKVYLAAWKDTIIFTQTSDGEMTYASKMYVKDQRLKATYCEPLQVKRGTTYKVLLKIEDFIYLEHNILQVITTFFNQAMIDGLKILVNGEHVEPWLPEKKHIKRGFVKIKEKEIPYTFILTQKDIPDERCNLEYHVEGKKITTRKPNFLSEVEPEFQKKFYVSINSFQISDQLNLNKTDFKSGFVTGWIFPAVEREIFGILKKLNLLKNRNSDSSIVTNALTKFFEKLFKDPKYSWLNPETLSGLNGPGNTSPIHDKSKDTTTECINRDRNPTDSGNSGNSEKASFSFLLVERHDDKREGWIHPATNRPVLNIAHPLYLKFEETFSARNYHVARVLIMALIRNGSTKRNIKVDEAMDLQSELLTLVKDVIWSV